MKKQKKTITTHITYLEMRRRPSHHVPTPLAPGLAMMRTQDMPLAYYRFLYNHVGGPHHWWIRRRMEDAELEAIIRAETTHIDVLYVGGCPAGFFELDTSELPERVDLAYFGLCPEYVGRGFGRWFLATAIATAWEHGPERVTVNTCTLDHPAALSLYQKMGFEPIGTRTEEVPAEI